MIVFAHTKFGLVRMKGIRVKKERGGGGGDGFHSPGLSEFLKFQHG